MRFRDPPTENKVYKRPSVKKEDITNIHKLADTLQRERDSRLDDLEDLDAEQPRVKYPVQNGSSFLWNKDEKNKNTLDVPVEAVTGPMGSIGPVGPRGETGPVGPKCLLYNPSGILSTSFTTLLRVPYDGENFRLKSILVSAELDSRCILRLLRSDNELILGELELEGQEKVTRKWDSFASLPEELTTLELVCKTSDENSTSKVLAVEFTM